MSEQGAIVYTAHIGIDWANSKHDVCVQQAGSGKADIELVNWAEDEAQVWALVWVQSLKKKNPK